MVARIALVGAFRRHQLDRLQPMRDADRVYRRQGIGQVAIGGQAGQARSVIRLVILVLIRLRCM